MVFQLAFERKVGSADVTLKLTISMDVFVQTKRTGSVKEFLTLFTLKLAVLTLEMVVPLLAGGPS